ncbi:pyruvate kinase [Candidatus Roizmanbacteria bacterium RIFOXYB2_FULL_41_10]|uniref:Pyruvate kinase n=1 Tax=Candidatus Roizmanbacteria bacterium RIFOXYA1_FULL_41_12 TaxID=1802082 RepID=A0A1F7K2A9_9BACT|nr:MAG: pyruvate kinase [Candidatus Roizmanbacteria bacterium RIFOXYA1_FULL_41_12]OGK66920.1 MAG: pyruvate kinase [Candidatus Roizmanbacteria bacterium RIFOXYB1_FULL_41_27]OGK67137.1 MAG: pyruvate kinase [Candidatus Roizmanbacteria bacterium RIFOXYA2_FULL_41_8]OGK70707.1 MAG: pyruvate kinase [Candidatus Roizmanbacteria bacterium RIFOXYC1_FULL_41_16]OGK71593.1 MAG: pyruvate kinase [Candidatus Roizmanbacteria bacterium RIFOXYB2_FULL_41_10]OGK75714.1 MAG: pyruvate kinase [Candidatus Roizmanbacter
MLKLTKIVATIGPASDEPEMIKQLIESGVNVFRFNFKHNTVDWHQDRIRRVNDIANRMKVNIGTLIDLQGPEIRIKMTFDQLELTQNQKLAFGERAFLGKEPGFSISHPSIISHLKNGQILYADDGYFSFKFLREQDKAYLIVQTPGVLKNNKSLNIPGADFPFPVLIERDFEGLQLALKEEIDFVALSFVRTHDDITLLRKEMDKLKIKAKIIAKIETKNSLENLDEIIDVSDAVMVARGDLGIELALEKVPYYQKLLIRKCLEAGKPVITATQMLESMINNPLPTRAEVSDVANAVYDRTDAVMLSAESASGKHPLAAVKYMAKTLSYTERYTQADLRLQYNFAINHQENLVADTAYNLYLKASQAHLNVKGFIVLTQTGRTVNLLSRYRAGVPLYAFCPSKAVADKLSLNYGVLSFVQDSGYEKTKEVTGGHVRAVIKFLADQQLAASGDKFIVIHGDYWAVEGGSSTVKIVVID